MSQYNTLARKLASYGPAQNPQSPTRISNQIPAPQMRPGKNEYGMVNALPAYGTVHQNDIAGSGQIPATDTGGTVTPPAGGGTTTTPPPPPPSPGITGGLAAGAGAGGGGLGPGGALDPQQVTGGSPAWGKFGPTIGGTYYGGVWGPDETGGRGYVIGQGATAPPGVTNALTLGPGQAAMQVPIANPGNRIGPSTQGGGHYVAYNPNDPNDQYNATLNQPVLGPGAVGLAGPYVVPGGSVAGGQTGLAANWQQYLPSTMRPTS